MHTRQGSPAVLHSQPKVLGVLDVFLPNIIILGRVAQTAGRADSTSACLTVCLGAGD